MKARKFVLAVLIACALLSAQETDPNDLPKLKPGLYAVMETDHGRIIAELYEKYAPVAVKTFVGLAQGSLASYDETAKAMVKKPIYNNIAFHRVLPGIMIQSGDPTGTGHGRCGFTIRDEFLPGILFDRVGRLAVANTGQPDSGGCQWFITNEIMKEWNGHYTIFGQVIDGQDVADKINKMPIRGDKPDKPAVLQSVKIVRVAKPGK
jgi:peptidyl-prolyl cis-trans isomerase A (cyclophilin A)